MAWTRPSLFRLARLCGAAMIVAAAVALVGFVLVKVATLTLAVFVAMLLTCLLWPVARRLERWRLPRSLASLLAVLLSVGLVAAAMAWIVPAAAAELSRNSDELVERVRDLWTRVSDRVPERWKDAPASLPTYLQENSARIISGLSSGLVTATELVGGFLLALVLTFFFLRDGAEISARGLSRLSREKRSAFEPALKSAWHTLRGWIRGAALIAAVDAIGIGVGLAILGVPLVLPLALLTFFAAFVPILGATVAGAVAVLVAWATNGSTHALITLAIVVGVQQLEGNVLEPLVMGRSVRLHPAMVLIVVTAGTLLAGIPGAFAAVPLTATVLAFMQEARHRSRPPPRQTPGAPGRSPALEPEPERPPSPH